jgi:hypothetical protein
MNALEKLTTMIDDALDNVRAEEFSSLALALRATLPEVINALQAIMVSAEATITQKQTALNTILVIWNRCLKENMRAKEIEVEHLRHNAIANAARTDRIRAEGVNKRATLEVARHKQRIARTLQRARKEQEQNAKQV